jgi:hypothetical protein
MFKKYINNIMKFFKGQEFLFNDKSPIGEGVEVVKEIANDNVIFHSGNKMSLSELEQYGKDPLASLEDVSETTDASKSTSSKITQPLKSKKPAPYSDQPYGGLKKIGSTRTESSQYDKKEDEAIDDGKPYKAKAKIAGKPLNLNEAIKEQEEQRKQVERKLKQKNSSLIKGLDVTDDSPKSTNLIEHQPRPVPKKQTTLEKLVGNNEEKENYVDIDFNLKVTIKLPPRKILQSLEEYFDVNVIEELAEMIKEEVQQNSTSENFSNYIKEEVEKHIYPKRNKTNK